METTGEFLEKDLRELPPHAVPMTLLGVGYIHVRDSFGGDLYLTRFGVPHFELLQPENWRDELWFRENRERLHGTSTVYRVPTRKIRGKQLDLVVKWSRVGEDVPLDTLTMESFQDAEFNSPYEEFALVMEMREMPARDTLRTNRPLAIYVPPDRFEPWQTGRSRSRIARKRAQARDIELDICRHYIVLYQWIKGESSHIALQDEVPDPAARDALLRELTETSHRQLGDRGFMVIDHKPDHVILRRGRDGRLLRDRQGRLRYSLIDFELLVRTPEYQEKFVQSRRGHYLEWLKHRFDPPADVVLPPHLRTASVLDVDYVAGHAESTHGRLWVTGRDPRLFDYFVPERWRHTPRQKLSRTNETYYTLSKDNLNLVWKLSRVGDWPRPEDEPDPGAARDLGFNSPFEEFAIALDLHRKGVPVTAPRAIYRTGLARPRTDPDRRRYESHAAWRTPEDDPLLSPEHAYITVWGFWRCRGENDHDQHLPDCVGLGLEQGVARDLIQAGEVPRLIDRARDMLWNAGYEAVSPKPSHFILSVTRAGDLLRHEDGAPHLRVCNFELLRPRHILSPTPPDA